MAATGPMKSDLDRTQWYIARRRDPDFDAVHREWIENKPDWKTNEYIHLARSNNGDTAEVSDYEFTAAQLLVAFFQQTWLGVSFTFNAPRYYYKGGERKAVPPTIDGILTYTDDEGIELHIDVELKYTNTIEDNKVYFYTSSYQHKALTDTKGMYWLVKSTAHLGLKGTAKHSDYKSVLYNCYWAFPQTAVSVNEEIRAKNTHESRLSKKPKK